MVYKREKPIKILGMGGIPVERMKIGGVIYVAYICISSVLIHFQTHRAFKKKTPEKYFKRQMAPTTSLLITRAILFHSPG